MQSTGRVSPTAIVWDNPSVTRRNGIPMKDLAKMPTPRLLSGQTSAPVADWQGLQKPVQGKISFGVPKSHPIHTSRPVPKAHWSGIVGPMHAVYQRAWLTGGFLSEPPNWRIS